MSLTYSPQIQAVLFHAVRQMKVHTAQYITPVSWAVDHEVGEAHGTGWYLEIDDAIHLLTAEHVARELEHEVLAHFPKENDLGVRFTNPVHAITYPEDLAISRIDEGIWSTATKLALPFSRLQKSHTNEGHPFLFVHGFPGLWASFSDSERALSSKSLPYLTQECPLPADFAPPCHFSLFYPVDPLLDENGNAAQLVSPKGMSGSPVWNLNLDINKADAWTPEMATVCGSLFMWDMRAQAIVATKAERLQTFIAEARLRDKGGLSSHDPTG